MNQLTPTGPMGTGGHGPGGPRAPGVPAYEYVIGGVPMTFVQFIEAVYPESGPELTAFLLRLQRIKDHNA